MHSERVLFMKNAFKITFAYLAAVIGAGFASGSEAVFYFVRFGKISFFGILLTSIGFGLFAYLTVEICRRSRAFCFPALAESIMPRTAAIFMRIVLDLFMATILAAMICAFAHTAEFIFGAPPRLAAAGFSILCLLILYLPEEAIINQTSALGIFIVVFICAMCIYMINNRCIDVFSPLSKSIFSSVSYTSYNAASACPLLCSAAASVKTRRQSSYIGIISGMLSFFALFLIWALISVYYGKIPLGELPMLTLAARQGFLFCMLYAAVMTASVFTTAAASAFGLLNSAFIKFAPKKLRPVIVISAGYFISSVGFSAIVSRLYNAAGICTLILPVFLFLKIFDKQR